MIMAAFSTSAGFSASTHVDHVEPPHECIASFQWTFLHSRLDPAGHVVGDLLQSLGDLIASAAGASK